MSDDSENGSGSDEEGFPMRASHQFTDGEVLAMHHLIQGVERGCADPLLVTNADMQSVIRKFQTMKTSILKRRQERLLQTGPHNDQD